MTVHIAEPTAVCLSFPHLRRGAPAPRRSTTRWRTSPARRQRVLVVDDRPALQYLMTQMLSRLGRAGETASSAEAAFAKLACAPFDLVLADLWLGDGPTGLDLAWCLRQRGHAAPVVLVTNYESIPERLARAAGVAANLTRPFGLRELRDVIDRLAYSAGADSAA